MDYSKSGVLVRSRRSKTIEQVFNETFQNYQLQYDSDVDADKSELKILSNESTNASSYPSEYVPYIERPETFIVPVLFGIIFICGVIGNGTLIVIFLRNKSMRNVPNMFICSLSIGDLLVILFCVPFTSTVYTVESWPYGLIVCKFSEFIKDVSIGVSVFTLTALSADRYFAIVDPIRKLTGFRATRITGLAIVGIWIVSILIALPSALFSYIRVIDYDPTHTYNVCYPFPPELTPLYPKAMVMLKFLVYYAIPLGFIASFYIVMARHLVLSTKNMPGEAQGQGKQIQARKKVAKMVLSFVVIFALCFFPSHVFLLWFYYDPNSEENFNEFWNLLRIIGFCLGFMNSCINPITLYCLSGTFRKHFNNSLFCCGSRSTNEDRTPRGRNLCGGGCISMSNSNHPGAAYGFGGGASDTFGARGVNGRLGSTSTKRGDFHRGSTTTKLSVGSTKRHHCTWDSPAKNQGSQKIQSIQMSKLNVTTLNLRSPFCSHSLQTPPQNTNFPLTSISLVPDPRKSEVFPKKLDDTLKVVEKGIVEYSALDIEKDEIMTSFINQPICINNVNGTDDD